MTFYKWIFTLSLVLSCRAWAFPEMVRHGYSQCTSCHVSPTGGGVLTAYGRDLAAEVLSAWSYADEGQFAHSRLGKDFSDMGVLIGGDIRGIEFYQKSPGFEKAQTFMMMADLQTAFQTGKFTGVVSIGEITDVGQGGIHGNFNATQYYGMVNITDQFVFRAGRFRPAFGINLPDHTLAIKAELFRQRVPSFQYDTVELDYLGDRWTVQAAAARALPSVRNNRQESVRALTVDYSFLSTMRAGVSYWSGSGPVVDRHMVGAHAILGFTKHLYNMTEVDYKYERDRNAQSALTQLAYEIHQGITPYLQYQRAQIDLKNGDTTDTYGVGFHFYPRPHLELSGEWDHSTAAVASDGALLLAHYFF